MIIQEAKNQSSPKTECMDSVFYAMEFLMKPNLVQQNLIINGQNFNIQKPIEGCIMQLVPKTRKGDVWTSIDFIVYEFEPLLQVPLKLIKYIQITDATSERSTQWLWSGYMEWDSKAHVWCTPVVNQQTKQHGKLIGDSAKALWQSFEIEDVLLSSAFEIETKEFKKHQKSLSFPVEANIENSRGILFPWFTSSSGEFYFDEFEGKTYVHFLASLWGNFEKYDQLYQQMDPNASFDAYYWAQKYRGHFWDS